MPSLVDVVLDALHSLFSRGVRTLLTMSGVILGLGSLVALAGVSESLGENVVRQFDRYAATQVLLSAPGAAAQDVTPVSLDQLRSLDGVDSVTEVCHAGTHEVTNPLGGSPVSLEVIGVSTGGIQELEAHLASGTDFTDAIPDSERVALVGVGVARRLDLASPERGTSLLVDGRSVSVVGVVDDIPRLPMLLNQVVMPQGTVRSVWGATCATIDIVVRTQPNQAGSIGAVARHIVSPHRVEQWTVAIPPSPDSLRHGVVQDLSALYAVISGISFAVGALSIGNTMSVSVLERRSEIGLRRAVGYSRAGIFALFSIEAFSVGFMGGLLAASLGSLTVVGIALANHWPIVISPTLVLAAPALGGFIGLVGGLVPALNAARVYPATALRS